MKVRPWPLVFLALCQIATPFASVLLNAYVWHWGPLEAIRLMWGESLWSNFLVFGLMPLGGVAIYWMKWWSYPVFLMASAITGLENARVFASEGGEIPKWLIPVIYLPNVIIVGYYLLPQVRRVYFDSRIRWWEAKPRYLVQVPALFRRTSLESGDGKLTATITDFSSGGVFLKTSETVQLGDVLVVETEFFETQLTLRCQVVHVRDKGDHRGYGVCWRNLTLQQALTLHRITSGLAFLGVAIRNPVNQKHELELWFKGLVRERKGVLPTSGTKN